MIIYWFAHMDWPFIENTNNFIVDYHLVYGGVLVYLIVKQAGHVFGLDSWAENLEFIKQHPGLKPRCLKGRGGTGSASKKGQECCFSET